MNKIHKLTDINTGESIFPMTNIDAVEGLKDKISELANKEDKDTIYDDTDIKNALDVIDNIIKSSDDLDDNLNIADRSSSQSNVANGYKIVRPSETTPPPNTVF